MSAPPPAPPASPPPAPPAPPPPPPPPPPEAEASGLHAVRPLRFISLFVRHANAANLLMAGMLLVGLFALSRLNTQFFPVVEVPVISMTVVWPGASAEDVDTNIVEAVEPVVRFLDGVKKVESRSAEGLAIMRLEFEQGADMQKALSDVEASISGLTTLPVDSERPTISRVLFYETVSSISVSGPFREAALRGFAKTIRDELLEEGVDRVLFSGMRSEEIWVNVTPEALRRLDLTLGDIAGRVGAVSQDLPSGTLEGDVNRQLRSIGLTETSRSVGGIEIRAMNSGEKVLLRDIADVQEQFDDKAPVVYRNGTPAILLSVQRAAAADTLEVAARVDAYLERLRPTLPPTLKVEQYDVQSNLVTQRIALLLKNGLGGLALVLLVLFVFLNARVAFWVAVGIPIAMISTFAVMYATGQTINMVSLFALIMTVGIIVDDAIVVGEHATARHAAGEDAASAAENGATRMLGPVMASALTTIAAFGPIFLITDIIGQILVAMPLVVISVLIASLVECFLILPGHMRSALLSGDRDRLHAYRERFNAGFDRFRDWVVRAVVARCYAWRYTTLSCGVAALILSVGVMGSGAVGFQFFPVPEADVVQVNVVYASGAPREQTLRGLEAAAAAVARAEDAKGGGEGTVVLYASVTLGQTLRGGGIGDNFGTLFIELLPSEMRRVRTPEFIEAIRAEMPPLAGLERIAILPRLAGPPGRDVEVRLSGGDSRVLKQAALDLRRALDLIPGVSDVEDNLPYGKREVILSVTPAGAALGFTTQDVGRQIRNAFQGAIAKRFARGDEEVTIRVQLPKEAAETQSLHRVFLKSPGGLDVPLTEVVALREETGFASIRRIDGRRNVSVTAEVDPAVNRNNEVAAYLASEVLPGIARRYDLKFAFGGRAEEQASAFTDIRAGFSLALLLMYIILAWTFASYGRPVVVMSIIPFGLVGAILGHLVMGFDLTILSMVALLGLSGILVNNSIILMSEITAWMERGLDAAEAVGEGIRARLRAVMLTSITTVFGLLPLLFETSLQAQFLLPMAITLAWGLGTATFLVVLVVPAIFGIQEDLAQMLRARFPGRGRRRTA